MMLITQIKVPSVLFAREIRSAGSRYTDVCTGALDPADRTPAQTCCKQEHATGTCGCKARLLSDDFVCFGFLYDGLVNQVWTCECK
jgi:hypothetical protein